MKPILHFIGVLLLPALLITACTTGDLFEKTEVIPGHQWSSGFKPSFSFTIKDTAAAYRVYCVLRHTDQYHFNNIYLNLSVQQPGTDSVHTELLDLKLGNDESGWMGSGMDDIFEHRVPITPKDAPFHFPKAGTYTFTLQQMMREDPLAYMLNAGIRIEKVSAHE